MPRMFVDCATVNSHGTQVTLVITGRAALFTATFGPGDALKLAEILSRTCLESKCSSLSMYLGKTGGPYVEYDGKGCLYFGHDGEAPMSLKFRPGIMWRMQLAGALLENYQECVDEIARIRREAEAVS